MLGCKKILTISFVSLLTACAGNSKIEVNTESGEKPAFDMNGSVDVLQKTDNQVALASFRVVFITEGKRRQTSENSGRWGSSGDVASSATVKTVLSGVDNNLMQNITDAAYNNFTSALTEKGFQVVPMAQVLASSEFKDLAKRGNGSTDSTLKTVGKLFVDDKEDSSQYPTYSPTGLPLIDSSFFCKQMEPLYDNLCLPKVANDMGVSVMHVNYVVDFSSFDSSAKSGTNYSSNSNYANAEVSTGQNLHLKPQETGIKVISKSGDSVVFTLSSPNPYQTTQAFGESVEATSTTDKVVSGFANVMGFLGGASGGTARSDSTVTYEMQAQPDIYKDMVSNILMASSKELAWTMNYYRNTK
tara:strand:+ start:1461 stop:2534 length:1074 start_codon:yes stop_codon:yes gene_type:complete